MNEANAALEGMIARLRGMRAMAKEIAVEAAPLVEGVVRRTAAAGTDVNGKAWPPKRDGTRALPNAASAVTAAAVGTTIVVTLEGAYAYHNGADGTKRRRILPEAEDGVPPAVAKAITEAASTVWRRRAGAR